jgi:hypothetical protein
MKLSWAFAFLLVAFSAHAEDDKFNFVMEYIHQLAAQEDIREGGEKDLANASDTKVKISTIIHTSTRMQLELQDEIAMLRNFHFDNPDDMLVPSLITVY